MKQSMYQVPEGFFAEAETKALSSAGQIRKRRIALLCSMPVIAACAYLGLALYNPQPVQDYSQLETCDIFLEVFEY